jgi:hypothetical protein
MSVIKYLIEIVLATIIIFFVWNILKRIFFNAFYKNFPSLNPKNREYPQPKSSSQNNIKEKVNWDAETVDYEEVKDENKK